jgi:hypothetical protein
MIARGAKNHIHKTRSLSFTRRGVCLFGEIFGPGCEQPERKCEQTSITEGRGRGRACPIWDICIIPAVFRPPFPDLAAITAYAMATIWPGGLGSNGEC